jgi:hypothetical protein
MPEGHQIVWNLEFVIWNFPEGVLPSQRVWIPTAGQIGLVVMRVFKADLPQVPIFTSKGVSPK